MHRAEDPIAVDLELAPVGVGELAKRLLVALSCTHQQSLAHREILALPVPFVAITTNDPKRGRKESGGSEKRVGRPLLARAGVSTSAPRKRQPGGSMATVDNPLITSAPRSGGDVLDTPDPRRWRALALLCGAFFMVILDATIVLVALPSIQTHLGFSERGLQWVLSAYALTFGGLLLLGGRAADLLGRRAPLQPRVVSVS